MMSDVELRQIIESAFLPLLCQCTCSGDGLLTVEVHSAGCHDIHLSVAGIKTAPLTSNRAVSNLIAELRIEMRTNWEYRRGSRHEA